MNEVGRRTRGWVLVVSCATTIAIGLVGGLFPGDVIALMTPFMIAAGFGIVSGVYLIVTKPKPSPPVPAPAPRLPPRRRQNRMPAPQSAANQPMQGLTGAEAALTGLLGQLRDADNTGPAWIANSWEVARTAAAEFRAVAGKLEAVEVAIAHTPPSQRPTLHEGVARLRTQLDQGLEAYQGMVAAASKLVLASAPASTTNELTEAADTLAGSAQALTELTEQFAWLQNR